MKKIKIRTRIVTLFVIMVSLASCQRNHINIKLDNARGLVVGDKVVSMGTQVGKVSDINIAGVDLIVELKLEGDFLIPKGSEVSLVSTDILGTKAIEIALSGNNDYYTVMDTLICEDRSATKIDSALITIQSAIKEVKDSLPNMIKERQNDR